MGSWEVAGKQVVLKDRDGRRYERSEKVGWGTSNRMLHACSNGLYGTDKGETRAKAEIWSDGAKFKAANDKMVAEVAKLETAAKSGSLDAIKAAMGAVGASCKACHDDFRAEKYSN